MLRGYTETKDSSVITKILIISNKLLRVAGTVNELENRVHTLTQSDLGEELIIEKKNTGCNK